MTEPDLDARQATAIAAGMKAVALADGEAHPTEMSLIEGFLADLPEDIDVSGACFDTEAARGALLQSLYLVALVDGKLKDSEIQTIRSIATAHGASDAEIEAAEAAARRHLLGRLKGVQVFRDEALAVAAELGVPADEASQILDADD